LSGEFKKISNMGKRLACRVVDSVCIWRRGAAKLVLGAWRFRFVLQRKMIVGLAEKSKLARFSLFADNAGLNFHTCRGWQYEY